jgi:hypothetical protein
MFVRYRENVDKKHLEILREIILSHDIVLPLDNGKGEERKKPVQVSDFLKVDPTRWFWREHAELIRAAELYLSLESKI